MAHKADFDAADPRMRAYWSFHGAGSHKIPREGVRPDHFYSCDWCRPSPRYDVRDGHSVLVWSDRQTEVFLLPDLGDGSGLMSMIAGRLG